MYVLPCIPVCDVYAYIVLRLQYRFIIIIIIKYRVLTCSQALLQLPFVRPQHLAVNKK